MRVLKCHVNYVGVRHVKGLECVFTQVDARLIIAALAFVLGFLLFDDIISNFIIVVKKMCKGIKHSNHTWHSHRKWDSVSHSLHLARTALL